MFARLVRLQLSLLPAFTPESRGTLTLPQGVLSHGDVKASLGETERASVFALFKVGAALALRVYFGPTLYVDATFNSPPVAKGDDLASSASVRVFKNGQEILSGPWDGSLRVWRPGGRIGSVLMEVRDLNVMLDGAAFWTAIEGTWLGTP